MYKGEVHTDSPGLKFTPLKLERTKRFVRRPSEKSDRSSSKKSHEDCNIKQSYIKTPTMKKGYIKPDSDDFFKCLASSVITASTDKKHITSSRRLDNSARTGSKNLRMETLEAEIDLKNHEAGILSSQCQRYKSLYEQQKQRRRRIEGEKKELHKEIKQLKKETEKLALSIKKNIKEKEYLMKQIQFLEKINYDQKTRTLQSYREKYLETEVQKMRKQLNNSKTDRQGELEKEVKKIQEEKYTLQSHYKALKVANQCLIKQLNHNQQDLHEMILHSEEYTKLREKYMRFLQEYKQLRNQYWSLKTQFNVSKNDSSLFSITASEAQMELINLSQSLN